jgi:hypothetical protein
MERRILSIISAWLVLLALVWPAQAVEVGVQVENLAPEGGVYLSPVWVGFDGPQFRLFTTVNTGTPSPGLTRLATDGDPLLLQQEFRAAVPTGAEGLISAPEGSEGAPNFAPGTTGQRSFDLDPATNRFLNFASKVYPGTDAYIASRSQVEIFDAEGQFKGKQIITILGSEVLEVTPSGDNQNAATVGTNKSDLMITGGTSGNTTANGRLPGVVFDATASDTTLPNTVVARITIVPEPATVFLLAGGSLILLRKRRNAAPK